MEMIIQTMVMPQIYKTVFPVLMNIKHILETTTGDGKTSDDTTTEHTTEPTTTSPNFNFLDFLKTREYWGGGEINSSVVPKLDMPIKRIIIAHTRGQFCANEVR